MKQSAHKNPSQPHALQQELWQKQRLYVSENSAFYKNLWQGLELPTELGNLVRLPLTSKAELREAQAAGPPFGNYLAASRASVNRLHRTSGTTGQAMNLALSARD